MACCRQGPYSGVRVERGREIIDLFVTLCAQWGGKRHFGQPSF
jgi:hypothetical protein